MTKRRQAEIQFLAETLINLGKPVYMLSEFKLFLKDNRIGNSSLTSLSSDLMDYGSIKKIVLRSEGYKDVERIAVPLLNPTPYHYATSLRHGAYLCHASSMNILGLTQQIPKTIYVNKEQSQKPISKDPLRQESIDRAFSHSQRRSKYIFKIDNFQIILLSGKNSANTGVETDDYLGLPRTCLERTLIDITVRPRYGGGVFQVAQAFEASIPTIDFKKLLRLLKKLNYKYPYHQSLGFYLEKAGAGENILSQLRNLGTDFDFYLDYSIASPKFDNSWRVYFPPGI